MHDRPLPIEHGPGTPAAAKASGVGGMRLSTRLLLIIATCLLPILALQAVVGWQQWQERKAQIGDLALHQAELLAADIGSIAEGARMLLATAGQFNQVRTRGQNCDARLAAIRRDTPRFAFYALLDAEGRLACVSDPGIVAEGDDLGWAREAAAATRFGAGRYARSARLPGGFLPFHQPLPATPDGRSGTIVAALDLGWLERHLVALKRFGSPFLADGVLTVADADGRILARDARHAEFVGQLFPPAARVLTRAQEPGILRLRSIDGTERVVGFTPPTPDRADLSAVVGFFEPDLMGDIARALRRGALLFTAAGALAVLLTWLVARRAIAGPTESLLAVARRWREGDLAARAPACGGRSEFGQLAAAFNAMAAALEKREAERRGYAEALEARVAERTRELEEVNARLRAEAAERRAAEAALHQSQKMEALGQLAGGVAHDFNNVLQAVAGGARLIQRRTADPAAVERLAGMIEDAARRGESVTRRLLAFSRRGELQAGALDAAGLLGGLREVLAATLGANIRVEVEAPPGLPCAYADRGQLETALVNLAANARDAMPAGGRLLLSARADTIDTDGPDRPAPGEYLRIDVEDTGEGMDAATLARASEPFFTTKPQGRGTGLGLAMARSFAEGSGGALAIVSARGHGTRVSLWLPVACPDTAAEPQPAAAPEPDSGEPALCGLRPRVLLVDDEPVVREVLAAGLAEEGCEVTEAGDGPAALALLESGLTVDLVVSDLAMPGMDGVTVIREARRQRPRLPAILLTGFAGDASALEASAVNQGPFSLLRKPVSGPRLADEMAVLLAVARSRRGQAARRVVPGHAE